MRQEENERYEQWLQQVRKTQPILTRPDDLTRNILQKSSPDSPKKKGAQKIHGLGFGRGCRFLALLYGA